MIDSPEHEAKCQRCGISCHVAALIDDGRRIVVEGLHCKYLGTLEDGRTGCRVYEKRFELAPWCLPASVADDREKKGVEFALREGCPYQSNKLGKGKQRVSPEEYAELWPQIEKVLLSAVSANPHFTWEKFSKEARKFDPDFRWKTKLRLSGASVRVWKDPTFFSKIRAALGAATAGDDR